MAAMSCINTPFVNAFTTPPNAIPMMIATASSNTFPRDRNALNSFSMCTTSARTLPRERSDRIERAHGSHTLVLAAETHQRELDRELHVGEGAVAELEVEPGRLRWLDPVALDALAHAADLGHAIHGEVRRVREVGGEGA